MAVVSYSVTDHAGLSIAEAARLVANRELSPVELVRSCLDRAEAVEDTIQAFVTLDPRSALKQARGAAEREPVGPLHGIPVAIKDLIDVAGLPTTASSRVLQNAAPALVDAPVVARLRTAGAVIVGKTNTQEFAYGVVSAPTRNPWDTDRIPGGSSGGSAAATATGMCLGALGTDTAGSVRIPAALCGVTGLKTAPGSLPVDGIIPLAPSLDVCGPIGRSALDCDLIWSALTGNAPGHSAPPDALRVGAPASPSEIGELDDNVEEAVGSMIECLSAAGARRVTVDLPHLKEWDRPRSIPLMTEALLVHKEAGWYPQRAALYEPDTRAAFEYAAKLSAADLVDAYKTLEGLTARFLSVLDDVDVLILATTPVPAPSVEEAGGRDGEYRPPVTRSLTRICGPVNWCRLAAISVPCGFSSSGLPIGAQIIGRDERTVLDVALLYQRLTDWHEHLPPILSRI
jgi:aspartyl-tRNA(Asn)/glutamyl-tRNA(Gln) amidotransferase subunit A